MAREAEKTRRNMPEDVIERRRRIVRSKEEIWFFAERLCLLFGLLILFFGVIFGVFPMDNNDMMPRIAAGDPVLFYRFDRNLLSQDLVIYRADGRKRVGRVVAKPGDTVEITENGELKVNGFTAYEEWIFYDTPAYDERVSYPLTLREDEYFLLADYREGARDSRYFGPVAKNQILGKVIAVMRWMNL